MAYWIIPICLLPVFLAGMIHRMKTKPNEQHKIIFAAFAGGIFLIVGYAVYAGLLNDVSILGAILGQTNPDDAKNIWGQRNIPYVVPFGYMFILCGVIGAVVKYVTSKVR